MRVGSVVRARNLRVIFDDWKSWVNYHPTENGKLYVVLVLGQEDWWRSFASKHCEEGRQEFWKELLHLAWEQGAAEACQQYADLLTKETP